MLPTILLLTLFAADPQDEEEQNALADVPELALIGDERMKTVRAREDEALNRTPKTVEHDPRHLAIRFAFNQELHRAFIAAGKREGLPLQRKVLPLSEAVVMQELSKGMRDIGFVPMPDGAPPAQTLPVEKRAAKLNKWCAEHRLEKFAGTSATLMQMLQVEDVPIRLALVEQLAKVDKPQTTALLANRAVFELSAEVRSAAVAALKKRSESDYLPTLLIGLRYPWPTMATHAADALTELRPVNAPSLLRLLLKEPDPTLPFPDEKTGKPMVAELVRVNHLKNCLLCHAPSGSERDGLVRGSMPRLGRRITAYYTADIEDFVRADTTLLRQDFSIVLTVRKPDKWPEKQRFDFFVRVRPATKKEITRGEEKKDYPQRREVMRVLERFSKGGGK